MITAIKNHFPSTIQYSDPDGGMFLWVILTENISSRDLFEIAIKEKIAFVPGDPFYTSRTNVNTMRLNFSCVDEISIEKGIRKLGEILNSLAGQ